ncbi:MAG: hypothetical protein IRY88_15175 [Rubrobacteraceae bacterium]|nr:hypothetical protein [Rubrobacteraceae bacterium]
MRGENFCYAHNPAYRERRLAASRRGGKLGGRGRPRREIQGVKERLLRLADLVERGVFDPRDANTIAQLMNVFLRALETERRLEELAALEQRVAALEEQGGYTWTANR